VDIAYLFGFYEKRATNASSIDPTITGGIGTDGTQVFGSFSTTAQVLMLSVTYRF